MALKIKLTDPERAPAIVQWLLDNVGPQEFGSVGTVVRGAGWLIGYNFYFDSNLPTYIIELDDNVDEETQLLFALRWS
jgi:hypothetical protein